MHQETLLYMWRRLPYAHKAQPRISLRDSATRRRTVIEIPRSATPPRGVSP